MNVFGSLKTKVQCDVKNSRTMAETVTYEQVVRKTRSSNYSEKSKIDYRQSPHSEGPSRPRINEKKIDRENFASEASNIARRRRKFFLLSHSDITF